MNRFQCCATCKNFVSERSEGKMQYFCSRLGYATRPEYKFDCWDPKEHIIPLMQKEKKEG